MNADQRGESGDDQLVSFREWNAVLEAEAMAPSLKAVYRQETVAFLYFCKIHHAGVSIILVKQYLPVAETQGRTRACEALRWWFRAAKRDGFTQRKTSGGTSTSDGPTAAEDAEQKRSAAAEAERLRRPAGQTQGQHPAPEAGTHQSELAAAAGRAGADVTRRVAAGRLRVEVEG